MREQFSDPATSLSHARQLHAAGDLPGAVDHLSGHARRWPDHAPALRVLGQMALDAGNRKLAAETSARLLDLCPDDAAALSIRARALVCLKDAAAGAALDALKAAAEADAEAAFGLAQLALDRKDGPTALKWLDTAIRIDAHHAPALTLRASCLARLARSAQALQDYDAALAVEPNSVRARVGRARLLSAMGDFTGAEKDLRAALPRAPDHPSIIASLLSLRPADEPTLLERAERLLTGKGLSPPLQIELGYAAAKAFARNDAPAKALAAAGRANALQAAAVPFDAAGAEKLLMRDFETGSAVAENPAPDDAPNHPESIFVCGLPRSGTTLVEQILARHSAVSAGGELPYFRKAAAWLDGQADPRAALGQHRASLADGYRQGLRERAAGRRYVVDKMPENWRVLGLIQHVLGPVRIIRVLRDPRDVGLSIYLEHFGPNEAFAHSVNGICAAIRQERLAFQHWKRHSVTAPVVIEYERLAEDPDTEIPRLLGAVGLTFENACLTPEKGDAVAATPSRWRVRQKIDMSSVGRWRAFAPFAPEIFSAFGKAAQDIGDGN